MRLLYLIVIHGLIVVLSGCTTTTTDTQGTIETPSQQETIATPSQNRYTYLTTFNNLNSRKMEQEIFKVEDRICYNGEGYGGETIIIEIYRSNGELFHTSDSIHVPTGEGFDLCFTSNESSQYKIKLRVSGIVKESKNFTVTK